MSTASTRPASPVASATNAIADVVMIGGTVRTLDRDGTVASALAIRDGELVLVGDDRDVLALANSDTRVVELAGRTAIPGINDSHLHGAWLGSMWPNTLMSPEGSFRHDGSVERLEDESAYRDAILRTGELLAGLGITSYTEPGLGPGEDDGPTGCFGSGVVDAYRSLAHEGRLTARVTALALFGLVDGPSDVETFEREFARFDFASDSSRWLRFAGVKIFADGIPPMRSAWTSHAYADGSNGDLLVGGADIREREANLRSMVARVQGAGLQVGVHATGDLSIETVLDELARDGGRSRAQRHYVIHGDMLNARAIELMVAAGVGMNAQPGLAGAEASNWPALEAIRAGVPVCFSSDSPVLSPDWRRGVAVAAELIGEKARDLTADGREARDSAAAVRERLVDLLLRCYTVNPARQDGSESWKGTLEPGKVADLCVLEADPYAIAPAELPDVPVDLTIAGGRVTFERG
jgi:predicted amidohydrolase YtcJ